MNLNFSQPSSGSAVVGSGVVGASVVNPTMIEGAIGKGESSSLST